MNVKELIEKLEELDEELLVVVEADHGQSPMKATWAGIGWVEDKEVYVMEETCIDEGIRVALIQGY